MTPKKLLRALVLIASIAHLHAPAAERPGNNGSDEFVGFWETPQHDGVVKLEKCALFRDAPATALCGTVVWDRELLNPNRTIPSDCNRKIFEADKYDSGVWDRAWAFDTRRKKFFNAKLRIKDDKLVVRVFVGSEVNGETMVFARVGAPPAGCEGRSPESTSVTGIGN